ncbi:MAG TPA: acyl-ACP thioesterase domain-containing protein [Acidimicrobiales bacterium]|nr:acyl-ACP thioesterase domain-containing protein [Acidimicrobiales bacterium]
MIDEPMVPLPPSGRVFRGGRRVRLADADPSGRLRLDSCARYLQDLGNDDTADSGIDDHTLTWVVRRAVIDVHRPPRWREWVDLATWCGGTGGRWAERRLSMVGEQGGAVEMSTLWVQVDTATGVPARLGGAFVAAYAEAAQGRRVSARLWLGEPTLGAAAEPWPLRAVDIDLIGHVNNAAYWAAVEQQVEPGTAFAHALLGQPHRAVIEYGPGIAAGDAVELLVDESDDHLDVWFTVDDAVQAAVRVIPLPQAAGVPSAGGG